MSVSVRPFLLLLFLGGLVACALATGRGAPVDTTYVIPDHLEIAVVGDGYQWEIRYPGPDGELWTADDQFGAHDVHLPSNVHATIHLRSRDYIYTFALPHLDLKEIAVPDLEYHLEFDANDKGRFELRGDQMCGYTHPDLIGTLVVESPEEYVAALRNLPKQGSSG